MPDEQTAPQPANRRFSFLKGAVDIVAPKDEGGFDWDSAASTVRQHIGDALNARHVSFLFGSGCSSLVKGQTQVGIPTMGPMANKFVTAKSTENDGPYLTDSEYESLKSSWGVDIAKFGSNLERLLEVLFSIQFIVRSSQLKAHQDGKAIIETAIRKVTRYILSCCTEGPFKIGDDSVLQVYQSFYRKLIFRDRNLPRPWVFTTNYDLFSERAMDRLGIPYCNGFSGIAERRFNPSLFRYALAEQLDITTRKWTAVDSFVYLGKLHGSVNWVEEGQTLFPIREYQDVPETNEPRVLIYPTPAKQNASLGSPYADLFREFHTRVVRDQSVLFTVGYSFSDEHINNIIFQALTIPNFRLIAFLGPGEGMPAKLKALKDPRIWIIGGDGPSDDTQAHYFDTVVDRFMPDLPGDKVDSAISQIVASLISKKESEGDGTVPA